MPGRTILHVDMDAFFAAVEMLDDPSLAGKAILVGGDGPRAVVTTASYEARRFGCHSAQPMSIAKRRCPHAIVVPVRGKRYREVSRQVFGVFERFTPVVEPLSIDEAFLDLTGTERLHGDGPAAARAIKQQVKDDTGLTASVGVAPNKFIAKLASDDDKPDGLTVVTPDGIDAYLSAKPIARMWGVGPATLKKFEAMHVKTFGDLARVSPSQLRRHFGDHGERFARLARGLDDRAVVPDHEAKSIGQEQTFGSDLEDADEVRRVMLAQADNVASRLRKHELTARTVTVKIRYGDFETITRSHTLDFPTDATDAVWHAARDLFNTWADASFRPVRLIGVSATGLAHGGQLGLFGEAQSKRQRNVDKATDLIRGKFGSDAIKRGGTM